MTHKIEEMRNQLWALIRRHQSEGGRVHNMKIGDHFLGREWGVYSGNILCLLGVICKYHETTDVFDDPVHQASKALNLHRSQVCDLEDGFEGWSTHNFSPFAQLGREIGAKLEEEAGLG